MGGLGMVGLRVWWVEEGWELTGGVINYVVAASRSWLGTCWHHRRHRCPLCVVLRYVCTCVNLNNFCSSIAIKNTMSKRELVAVSRHTKHHSCRLPTSLELYCLRIPPTVWVVCLVGETIVGHLHHVTVYFPENLACNRSARTFRPNGICQWIPVYIQITHRRSLEVS